MEEIKHTPAPWKWAGEDYRGGWGWQLLVGPSGEGIVCGESEDGVPYKHLQAFTPIAPKHCKTGLAADKDSAPAVHVRQADALLIAAAPELLEALERLMAECDLVSENAVKAFFDAREVIAKATGVKS